jgi:hypothetical protein
MSKMLLAGSLILALGCLACSGVAVTSDFEADYPFAGLRTYSFEDLPEGEGLPSAVDKYVRGKIRHVLDSAGYSESSDPDFKIFLHGDRGSHTRTATFGYMWPTEHKTIEFEVTNGTMFMDFVDPKDNELIWRASAEAGYSSNITWGQKEQMMERSVYQMLQKFPPRIKS